jgi:lipoyl-dependent peroxiredoxin
MDRHATAVWKGKLTDGAGTLTTQSGALTDLPYTFKGRFQDESGKSGTNPEELIAAAHAGCFTMALAFQLQTAGFTPKQLSTEAAVSLDQEGQGFKISKSALTLLAEVPGLDQATFDKLAEAAEKGCPVSKVLNAEITLQKTLK